MRVYAQTFVEAQVLREDEDRSPLTPLPWINPWRPQHERLSLSRPDAMWAFSLSPLNSILKNPRPVGRGAIA